MSQPLRTRFAPSPTGRLHLGNVRTALFNFLLARMAGGSFILRIEDTDTARSAEDSVRQIAEDLQWLGLHWDEGPDVGGEFEPYRQSARAGIYLEFMDRLRQAGHAYDCWRTDDELRMFRKARIASGRPPIYDRDWAALPEDEIRRRREAGQSPALRFRVPGDGQLHFEDCIRGRQTFGLAEIGDFVIGRSDGTPSFFFSNALDDSLMDLTHVLRGEDHLSNTPRQLLILQALKLPAPSYGHLPLLVGSDGAPLSKRMGSAGMAEFRDAGVMPEALVNYAARLGHASDSGKLMSLIELAAEFRLDKIGRSPARYDPIQLEHWQGLAVHAASAEHLAQWAGPGAFERVPSDRREAFLDCVRPNVLRPADIPHWADVLFGRGPRFSPAIVQELEGTGTAFFSAALAGIEAGASDLATIANAIKVALGVKGRGLYRPLRLALTGAESGPELGPLIDLLPTDTLKARLERWAAARDNC